MKYTFIFNKQIMGEEKEDSNYKQDTLKDVIIIELSLKSKDRIYFALIKVGNWDQKHFKHYKKEKTSYLLHYKYPKIKSNIILGQEFTLQQFKRIRNKIRYNKASNAFLLLRGPITIEMVKEVQEIKGKQRVEINLIRGME